MEQLVWCIISGMITLALAVIVLGLVFNYVPEGKISVTAYSYKNALIVSIRGYGNRKIYVYGIELLDSRGEPVEGCDLVFARVGGSYVKKVERCRLPSGEVLRLYYDGYNCRSVKYVIVKTNVGCERSIVIDLVENT
ncbi:MAG: hypothetical protein GXO10_07705 [Crenarchaeota archaeon]|nr:hypothetical protein [Thermoproteota archaeon]